MSDSQLKDFERRAKSLLQESADSLNAQTRSRLTQARHAAVDATVQPRKRPWAWLAPVTGATAAAVIGAILFFNPGRHHGDSSAGETTADELEIVTSEDSLEFYRDVEFYAWLDSVLDDAPAEETGA